MTEPDRAALLAIYHRMSRDRLGALRDFLADVADQTRIGLALSVELLDGTTLRGADVVTFCEGRLTLIREVLEHRDATGDR